MVTCDLVEATFVTENEEEAKRICNALVTKRLVASTHCFKVASNFIWDNKKEAIDEYKVNCLTRKNKLNKIEEVIREIHTYEIFQLTVVAIIECNEDFKNWVEGAING